MGKTYCFGPSTDGLVPKKRVDKLEKKNEKLKQKVEILELKNKRNRIINIISFLFGVAMAYLSFYEPIHRFLMSLLTFLGIE